jgi:hypothetical protein
VGDAGAGGRGAWGRGGARRGRRGLGARGVGAGVALTVPLLEKSAMSAGETFCAGHPSTLPGTDRVLAVNG